MLFSHSDQNRQEVLLGQDIVRNLCQTELKITIMSLEKIRLNVFELNDSITYFVNKYKKNSGSYHFFVVYKCRVFYCLIPGPI